MAATPMNRMQLLLPPALKAQLATYAEKRGLSNNEAARILIQHGLGLSSESSASQLAGALLERVRALEDAMPDKPQGKDNKGL